MATLSKQDMTKDAAQGPYAGSSRLDIMSLKIKDGRDFVIGGTKSGKKVKGASYDSKTETLTYYTDTLKKKTATTKSVPPGQAHKSTGETRAGRGETAI